MLPVGAKRILTCTENHVCLSEVLQTFHARQDGRTRTAGQITLGGGTYYFGRWQLSLTLAAVLTYTLAAGFTIYTSHENSQMRKTIKVSKAF